MNEPVPLCFEGKGVIYVDAPGELRITMDACVITGWAFNLRDYLSRDIDAAELWEALEIAFPDRIKVGTC